MKLMVCNDELSKFAHEKFLSSGIKLRKLRREFVCSTIDKSHDICYKVGVLFTDHMNDVTPKSIIFFHKFY